MSSKVYYPKHLKNSDNSVTKKFNSLIFKMGRGPEQTNGQQTLEKMFKITNHQGNENQNHSDISPHTHKNHRKDRK